MSDAWEFKRNDTHDAEHPLTVCRSVASFSMEGFKLSTAFRPSWKKLEDRNTRNESELQQI